MGILDESTNITWSDLDATYALKPDNGARAVGQGELVLNVRDFGAVGDGITDDTAAVVNCFSAANALARPGLTGTIRQPGATVLLTGTYKLSTIASPIPVVCNVVGSSAAFVVPDSYAGIAVRVGHPGSGSCLQNACISLPDIVKSPSASIVPGSIGCRVQNIGNSQLSLGRVAYFETGVNFTGDGQGAAYNTIHVGWISYCKVSISLKPHTPTGWCNQNTFVGGGIQQSTGFAGGTRVAGWRHLLIDGSAGNQVNGNVFVGTSFEGDVSEYWAEIRSASDNQFIGTRHELGTAGVAVTVSADTLTNTTHHGFAVGDMVTFSATKVPNGMVTASPYFVVTVPDANTFKVSRKKGGPAITFTTAGSGVTFLRPPRVKFDATGIVLSNNVIERPFTPQGVMEVVNLGTSSSNNIAPPSGTFLADRYVPEDIPAFRARNRCAAVGLTRAVFAAYPSTADPIEDPLGWTVGISDQAVLFAFAGAETARIYASSTGVLHSKKRTDAVAYELPTCLRTQSATTLTSHTIFKAGTRTTGRVTLRGCSAGDYVEVATTSGLIPLGLIISAVVTAKDTITYAVDNVTGSNITLSANVSLYFKTTRRFF